MFAILSKADWFLPAMDQAKLGICCLRIGSCRMISVMMKEEVNPVAPHKVKLVRVEVIVGGGVGLELEREERSF